MRIGLGVAVVFGVLLALGVWADLAERAGPERTLATVTSKHTVERSSGGTVYTVNWRSRSTGQGFVTRAATEGDDFVRKCFDQAVVGEPVPSACPTSDTIFDSRRTVSWGAVCVALLSLTTIGALWLYASRRVGQVPLTAPAGATIEAVPIASNTVSDPVALMQSAEAAKEAYSDEWQARQQLARPGRGRYYLGVGLGVGSLLMGVAGVLAGWSAGGEWGVVTALLIYTGVAVAFTLSLTSLMATETPEEGFYQRLAFFSGAATGLVVGGFIASLDFATRFEWDGVVRWLF
jgi:hypothetical protein